MQESGGKELQAEWQQVERTWDWSVSGMFEEEWRGSVFLIAKNIFVPISVSKISKGQEIFMFQEQKKAYVIGK